MTMTKPQVDRAHFVDGIRLHCGVDELGYELAFEILGYDITVSMRCRVHMVYMHVPQGRTSSLLR